MQRPARGADHPGVPASNPSPPSAMQPIHDASLSLPGNLPHLPSLEPHTGGLLPTPDQAQAALPLQGLLPDGALLPPSPEPPSLPLEHLADLVAQPWLETPFSKLLEGLLVQGPDLDPGAAADGADEALGEYGFEATSGLDLMSRLMLILSRNRSVLGDMVDRLDRLQQRRAERDELRAQMDEHLLAGGSVDDPAYRELESRLEAFGDLDGAFQRLEFEIQAAAQLEQQLTQMVTHLMRNDHEARMATIRNLRA